MNILLYGGSFNPPHLGHEKAVREMIDSELFDRIIVIPSADVSQASEVEFPTAKDRLDMCRIAFEELDKTEVSDIEILNGITNTADTIRKLRIIYPDDTFYLAAGPKHDIKSWNDSDYILSECRIYQIEREDEDLESGRIREMLQGRLGSDLVDSKVYETIIKNRFYNSYPELSWLRQQVIPFIASKRIAHVAGCETEAVMLAKHYGADEEKVATAAILHDITKSMSRENHLDIIDKYSIDCDDDFLNNDKLFHALTGAYLAREKFGIRDEVFNAIRWHTTGKPDMTLLEKIIYIADYIEPTRDFDGVDSLRKLAYEDIDSCMALGLEMSIEDIRKRNMTPYIDTVEAFLYYNTTDGDN